MTKEALKNYLDFTWAMTEKEIKARYKRASFGFLWMILNPLFQMLVIGVVFSYFVHIENYFLFLFIGLLLWQFFSISLSKTTPIFVYERSLLQKTKFSKTVLPISVIMSNIINLSVSFVILLIYLGITSQLNFSKIFFLVLAVLWLFSLTIGLSLLLSSLNVRFRDTSFVVQAMLVMWFYATPILYNLSIVPTSLMPLYNLNPLSSIFEIAHIALLSEGHLNTTLMLSNLFITALVIGIGSFIYLKTNKYFVDWL